MKKLTICLTHDVDRVYKSYQYVTHDLVKLKIENLKDLFHRNNPYWNFHEIMSIEKKYKVKSTFFFLEESIKFDIFSYKNWKLSLGKYKFNDFAVEKMIRIIDKHGWEIGLHGSYNSYKNLSLLKKEKNKLEKVVGKPVLGIRQHYLNLNIPETWIIQKKAGFLYDASFGIKNKIGFPIGKYHPFVDDKSEMLIFPLALMDGYLFKHSKDYDDAWNKCLKIIDEAEKNNALMVVLWHQRVFNEKEFPGYRSMYENIIVECKKRDAEFKLCRDLL